MLLLSALARSKLAVSAQSATKTDDSKMTDMKNELYILKKVNNPYIVRLYAHFVVSTC